MPSVIAGAASPALPAGGNCWPASDGAVVVPLASAATGARTLRIGYLAGSPGQVLVTFGARSQLYSFEKGLHSAYLRVTGGGAAATVVIQLASGALPCVGDAQAGALVPSEAGPAIPPLAVAG